ncbi:MarR family transcriptional regulator [[Mycobacterium] wendilense]|uniref:MarR family transcriptional regulator n=1 Tax=[Mycobacterium] wendilense TaxID=3064284 RepID=A0ABN9P8N8_9MYCO|nr:MarR family transcriptional regulator [Mycolicibacterium sp. MU0050]CAJ1584955.1 MarR family transcriptional regulator [Mycolicibacterium sp. MU0050]
MSTDATEATELRESVMALARQMRRHRRAGGLTLSQIEVLGEISRSTVITPAALGARLQVRAQSLTDTINDLESAGLVSRRPDPHDRRRQLLELTELGRRFLADDRAQRDRWLHGVMSEHLSDLETSLLMLVSPILRKLADAERAQSGPC